MKDLRGLIERMGEINLTAIEEARQLQERFDFLEAQRRSGGCDFAIGNGHRKDQQGLAKAIPRGLRCR